jgi:hypothetical protein
MLKNNYISDCFIVREFEIVNKLLFMLIFMEVE